MGGITFLRKYDFSIVDMTSIDFPLVFIEGNYRMVCLYPGGYRSVFSVSECAELHGVLKELPNQEGPVFLEVKVKKGSRKDLGRPTTTPIENKKALMRFLNNTFTE